MLQTLTTNTAQGFIYPVLFTSPHCITCHKLVEVLCDNGVLFEEIIVDTLDGLKFLMATYEIESLPMLVKDGIQYEGFIKILKQFDIEEY